MKIKKEAFWLPPVQSLILRDTKVSEIYLSSLEANLCQDSYTCNSTDT